jgi:hypothetical protein
MFGQTSNGNWHYASVGGVQASSLVFEGDFFTDYTTNSIGSPFFGIYAARNLNTWLSVGFQPVLGFKGFDNNLETIFSDQLQAGVRRSIRLWTLSTPLFLKLRGFSSKAISPFLELGPQIDIRLYNQVAAVYQSDTPRLQEAFDDLRLFSLGWWVHLGFEAKIKDFRFGLGAGLNLDVTDMQPSEVYSVKAGTGIIAGRVFFR